VNETLDSWIGRRESKSDVIAPAAIERLAALLDHDEPPWRKDELPPLGHWLFHLDSPRQADLGADGHRRKGHFIPPIPLPRRMWAGSRVRFHRSVPTGVQVLRESAIERISTKTTSRGEMTLVTVHHCLHLDSGLAIEESQELAYLRPRETPDNVKFSETDAESRFTRRLTPTTPLLFRFSALTYNAHRIHYDIDYATKEEGYPDLVTQGPLLAVLLMDHFLRRFPRAIVTECHIRAVAPVFCNESIDLCLADDSPATKLWITDENRHLRMNATILAAAGKP
jgi:3-methylfumaryl-CoA hydratase